MLVWCLNDSFVSCAIIYIQIYPSNKLGEPPNLTLSLLDRRCPVVRAESRDSMLRKTVTRSTRETKPPECSPRSTENGHLPPSPPRAPAPIDLAAILQQQNQLLQVLVTTLTAQAQGNLGNHRPAVHHNANGSRIADFNRLQPPKFGGSDNPIEADDWLREIEMKLEVVMQMIETRFCSQYSS